MEILPGKPKLVKWVHQKLDKNIFDACDRCHGLWSYWSLVGLKIARHFGSETVSVSRFVAAAGQSGANSCSHANLCHVLCGS